MDQYDILIPALTFIAVFCLGGALISASLLRRKALQARLQGKRQVPDDERTRDDRPMLTRLLSRIGNSVSSKEAPSALRKQLMSAGFHGREAVAVFLGTKVLLFAAGLVVLGMLIAPADVALAKKALMAVAGASLFFYMPNLVVQFRRQSRCTEVRRHLPDVVDLLEICVSGGMGLDQAWNSVADEIRVVSPLLANEMVLTNLEIHLGEERGEAIRHMAERTGADELSSLVAVLVQSYKFGTSVSEALRVFATSMRELRSQRAEESAEKMAVKMLFPMTVLIFPVVLIVAVGPAGITLVGLFGGN